MNELVQRLSEREHPVEVSLRPERTALALKNRIDDYAFVHILFTGTRGGTELGVMLSKDESDFQNGDFERGTGRIRLAGTLTLNYEKVRCIADVDLETLSGTGRLELLDTA